MASEDLSPGWFQVDKLKIGDLLKTKDGWQEIESIELINQPGSVYNLSVGFPHTFWAGGVLAHNKDFVPPVCHNLFFKKYNTDVGGNPAWEDLTGNYSNLDFESSTDDWTVEDPGGCISSTLQFFDAGGFTEPGGRFPGRFIRIQHKTADPKMTRRVIVPQGDVYRVLLWSMATRKEYGCPDCEWVTNIPVLGVQSGLVGEGLRLTSNGIRHNWAPVLDDTRWVKNGVIIWAQEGWIDITLGIRGGAYSNFAPGALFDAVTIERLPVQDACFGDADTLLEILATDADGLDDMEFSDDGVDWHTHLDFKPVANTSWIENPPGIWNKEVLPFTPATNDIWVNIIDGSSNVSDPPCHITAPSCPVPTCDAIGACVINPGKVNLDLGETTPTGFSLTITDGDVSNITNMTWSTLNNRISWSPLPLPSTPLPGNTDNPYTNVFTVTADEIGPETLTVDVTLDSGNTCSCSTNFNSTAIDAWYRTQSADVYAGGGILTNIPPAPVGHATPLDFSYSLDGDYTPGFPGIVYSFAEAGFEGGLGTGYDRVSSKNWLVRPTDPFNRSEKYAYFEQIIESPIPITDGDTQWIRNNLGGSSSNIYYIVENPVGFDDLILDHNSEKSVVSGGRRIVILVPDDLRIENGHTIQVDEGSFLAFVVGGDVIIAEDVKDKDLNDNAIDGVFIVDGTFRTLSNISDPAVDCIGLPEGDELFNAEGIFVANNFELNRNVCAFNNYEPAEHFTYRPDFWVTSPYELWQAPFTWQELAP
ncbi:Hint domain-containing protein [Patescibacteria group bacterium]